MHADFVGAGWGFPLRLDPNGGIALVRRERELEEAIQIILLTYPGERPMRPEFGSRIRDFVFTGIDTGTLALLGEEVRQSLRQWEPRVDVVQVRLNLDEADPSCVRIGIEYQVKGTNDRRNLVFPFYTIPEERSEVVP